MSSILFFWNPLGFQQCRVISGSPKPGCHCILPGHYCKWAGAQCMQQLLLSVSSSKFAAGACHEWGTGEQGVNRGREWGDLGGTSMPQILSLLSQAILPLFLFSNLHQLNIWHRSKETKGIWEAYQMAIFLLSYGWLSNHPIWCSPMSSSSAAALVSMLEDRIGLLYIVQSYTGFITYIVFNWIYSQMSVCRIAGHWSLSRIIIEIGAFKRTTVRVAEALLYIEKYIFPRRIQTKVLRTL